MAKYSPEFKLHVVNEYLQGTLGYRLLAKKYHIPSKSQIETWVRQYKQTGRSGVQRKEKQEYTGESNRKKEPKKRLSHLPENFLSSSTQC